MTLTRAQRVALKSVYDRQPLYRRLDGAVVSTGKWRPRATYREFRRTVRPELAGFGAAMVPWSNMWLGIERDGHVHS